MDGVIFGSVIAARILVPLAIPRFPLPAMLVALVIDGIDQTIFQTFTSLDLAGYQNYDKALDVYYLSIAYTATLRNWTHHTAVAVGRFLYYFRLVGVVIFEVTQIRAVLLIFPNTFEYFFDFYEAVRARWDPRRMTQGLVVGAAAFIWIFIKLPQEWWIHVAQLDFTDFLADHAWAGPTIVVLLLVAFGVFWIWGRPRLLPADHTWRFRADPLPEPVATASQQGREYAEYGAVWSMNTLEKVVLLGLLSVIFGQTLPGFDGSNLQLFVGVAVVVVINAVFSLAMARRARTVESTALAFLARMVGNVALVVVAAWLLPRGDDISVGATLFFLTMISLLTTLHDRWYSVMEGRVAASEEGTGVAPVTS